MHRPERAEGRGSRALRDLLVVVVAAALSFWAFATTSVAHGVRGWLQRTFAGSEVEVVLGFAMSTLAFALLATLRWRDASRHLAARRQAEERYREVLEKIPAVTYTWDPTKPLGASRVLYVSPQVRRILGFSVEDWTVDPELWMRQIHPEDREAVLAASERADRTGEPFVAEYRHRRPDGRIVWIHEEAVAVANGPDGRPSLVQGVMYDITDRRHAEDRLRDAEARYRTLVERVPAVTYVWDSARPDGRPMRYVSPQLEPLLGLSVEEWTADPTAWARHVHPEDLERVAREWREAEAERGAFRSEYRIVRGGGTVAWIRDEAIPLEADDDAHTAYQGVMLDITERKHAETQLREAEARYRAIVEHIPGAIYVDVPDGSMRTIYVSPQIREMIGVTPDEWIADPNLWLAVMHPEDRMQMERSYAEAVRSGATWRGEYRVLHPEGRWVWLHDETTFVRDEEGRPLFLQGVLFDITERKLAEGALQSSERREREAAERLRALDDMKNTFLAAVSHELRSPLTSILGLSLTLQQQDVGTEDRGDLLARLAANARKLDRLLGDLLDIDRLNRGIVTPQYRPTDLGDLVRRTVENLDGLGDRHVVVDVVEVVIQADPAKVERIVENLVVNALRHTAQGSTVWVRVRPETNGALIAVEDDGAGVPSDLRREIFEPFRQGPTASPHSPGTGIGLSLVSMFSELHGGRAWVEDRNGGGASFRVFLPAHPSRPEGVEPEDADRLESAGAG